MHIQRKEEYSITTQTQQQINALFQLCFSDYPKERTFFKQLPNFRYLAYEADQLVGHLAVDHRVMNIGDAPHPIFGVTDLCVHPDFQSRRLASQLLNELEELGQANGIEFIVLVAKDHGLYENNGYQLVSNHCKWLIINNSRTLGVGSRRLDDCLMYKPLGKQEWEEGLVDFMGAIF